MRFCLARSVTQSVQKEDAPLSQQRSLAQHRIHKVLNYRIMQIGVRRQILAAAGIDQLRTIQRT